MDMEGASTELSKLLDEVGSVSCGVDYRCVAFLSSIDRLTRSRTAKCA